MNNILLLASQSTSRRLLLSQVEIPFVLIEQEADESQCDWGMPLAQLVESIATYKMQHVIMPNVEEGKEIFVLTADTLTQDLQGNILGKPESREHAFAMLKQVRKGARVGTAFCLDKKVFCFDEWQTKERNLTFVESRCIFDVPDNCLYDYVHNTIALKTSGAIVIEGYGAQFLQSVEGSYSTIMGLPLFELREALEKMNFY